MDFNLNLDFTTAGHDAERLAEIIQAAVTSALDANGIEPPHVTVTPAKAPRILVCVKGGIAEVDAVDGRAEISIADFDTNEDVAAIGIEIHEGSAAGFDGAFGKAENRLGIAIDDSPAPRFGR